ncbi:hypothetical protein [Granulicella arctica]|uniref:hypothetical protein n=1 Tax=Granulicella arctica TaxID=940613 RepID=UPI0021DFBE46|nr:hypothetical protein [Granulicella arctica]
MAVKRASTRSVTYFQSSGRVNLKRVVTSVLRNLKNREELRSLKLVFFTAYGEGPLLASGILRDYEPKMIAVTFPPSITVFRGNATVPHELVPSVTRYLEVFDVKILAERLPFSTLDVDESRVAEIKLVESTLATVASSFPLCVQAVLQACDHGLISVGEQVIGITGDFAALISACGTENFFSKDSGFFIHEIFCKPSQPYFKRTVHAAVDQNLTDNG